MRFRIALAGCAAAIVTLIGIASAGAEVAPSFTVSAGSAPAGRQVGLTLASPKLVFHPIKKPSDHMVCGPASINASIITGTGLPQNRLIQMNGASLEIHDCAFTEHLGVSFTVTGSTQWSNRSYCLCDADRTGLIWRHIRIHFAANAGPPCSFDLYGGSPVFEYTNSTGVEKPLTNGIPVTNVSGCAGYSIPSGSGAGWNLASRQDDGSTNSFSVVVNNPAYRPLDISVDA